MVTQDGNLGPPRDVENETHDVFPSVCSQQCNDAANRRLMEDKAPLDLVLSLPLGLDLQITPTLVNSIQNEVNKKATPRGGAKPANLGQSSPIVKFNELGDGDKLRASIVNASTIKIGSWEGKSAYASGLVMKIYFGKRRVVWELLHDNRTRKKKIEMRWNDIIGIRVTMEEDKPGVLELELEVPPSFMEEMEPQPRKHAMWLPTNDFTDGQASICRRHLVTFPSGTLDKHMQKLFLAEPRLLELSTQGFPTMPSPHFERRPTAFLFPDFNGGFQPFGLPRLPTINNFPMAAVHPSLQQLPSPMSDQHFLHDGRVYASPSFVPRSTSNAGGLSDQHFLHNGTICANPSFVRGSTGNADGLSDQHFLHDGRVYANPSFVPGSTSDADGLSGGQVHGIASNVAPSTLVSPALYHHPLGEHGLEAQGGNCDPRKIKAIEKQLQNEFENVSWTAKKSAESIDSWNAMLNASRDGSCGIKNPPHYEHDSNSTIDDNAGGNENVPITPDSQFYQTALGMPPSLSHVPGINNSPHYEHDRSSTVQDNASCNDNVPIIPDSQFYQTASGMPPSLSHVPGINNSPHYKHDRSSTVQDNATCNDNVPIIPDSQFYQTASGMPPSLSQVQPVMMHQNGDNNLVYDPNAYYKAFGGDRAHLFSEQEEK